MDKILDKEIDMAGKYRVRVLRTDGLIQMLKFENDPTDEEVANEIEQFIIRENAGQE